MVTCFLILTANPKFKKVLLVICSLSFVHFIIGEGKTRTLVGEANPLSPSRIQFTGVTKPDYVSLEPLELVYGWEDFVRVCGCDFDGSSEDQKRKADSRGRACEISTGNMDSLGNWTI